MPKIELTQAQKLAELLHKLNCVHTGNICSWDYLNPWTDPELLKSYAHPFRGYLESAERILAIADYEQAIEFLSAEYGKQVVDHAIRQLGL